MPIFLWPKQNNMQPTLSYQKMFWCTVQYCSQVCIVVEQSSRIHTHAF